MPDPSAHYLRLDLLAMRASPYRPPDRFDAADLDRAEACLDTGDLIGAGLALADATVND